MIPQPGRLLGFWKAGLGGPAYLSSAAAGTIRLSVCSRSRLPDSDSGTNVFHSSSQSIIRAAMQGLSLRRRGSAKDPTPRLAAEPIGRRHDRGAQGCRRPGMDAHTSEGGRAAPQRSPPLGQLRSGSAGGMAGGENVADGARQYICQCSTTIRRPWEGGKPSLGFPPPSRTGRPCPSFISRHLFGDGF